MAWTFVGSTDLGNVHSGARAVTAGNLLLAIYLNGASGDVPTLSDGVNTWTKIGVTFPDTGSGNSATWWWAPAQTTATITGTVTNITGSDEGMAILEWHSSAGAVPSDSFETENRRQQGTGSIIQDDTTSNVVSAPANNGDLFVSWVGNFLTGTNTLTSGTGFTDRFTGTGAIAIRVEDFIQSTAAAKTATWTNSVDQNTVTFAAFFKESGGAPPSNFTMGVMMMS